MSRFRSEIIVLHVPTRETNIFRKDFDTVDEALSRPIRFLRLLYEDPDVQLHCEVWSNVDEQRHEDGTEEIFGCYFRSGDSDEVHGMALVSALGDGAEPGE